MSTFLEQTRARVPRLADAVQQRARLSVVTGPAAHAPRLPFAAFVLAVAGLGLVGLLVLNTSLQQSAFYARSLAQQAENLEVRKEALALRVDALRAPDRVAREAQSMGMLPNHNPAFLFLADGTVRGDAEPADPAEALRLHPADPALAGGEDSAPAARHAARHGAQQPQQHATAR
ncbi:MAG TPA: hypothetical protein VFJ14_13930 [Nocardioidaceae bacterium]|nr:hypothetical protein [Nocardioidaceae bacterium]